MAYPRKGKKRVDSSDNKKSKNSSYQRKRFAPKKARPDSSRERESTPTQAEMGLVRLNKYIANSGVCSRREADKLIATGVVKINGKVVTEMGVKVSPGDVVHFGDDKVVKEKPMYLLLNKPKGYITTVTDPQKRKTVLDLVGKACKERLYPVGRLDKDTTGLLLFTNDGDLTKKLTHPKYQIKKVYHVVLHKNVTKAHLEKMLTGIELEDGFVKADEVSYVGDGKDKKQIGIELHSGKNRVIRRMMEALGYTVTKLDRVYFAGLTKKDVPRGKHKFLTSQEISMLKRLG
ncbi:MAG: rRNA pseudouridine synthase [Flavobacteriales bacterium]|nr:rRNA pseudouridine synthase [Flavobacteriales bacterium]